MNDKIKSYPKDCKKVHVSLKLCEKCPHFNECMDEFCNAMESAFEELNRKGRI